MNEEPPEGRAPHWASHISSRLGVLIPSCPRPWSKRRVFKKSRDRAPESQMKTSESSVITYNILFDRFFTILTYKIRLRGLATMDWGVIVQAV